MPDVPVIQGAARGSAPRWGRELVARARRRCPSEATIDDTLFVHASPVSDIEPFGRRPTRESDDQLLAGVEPSAASSSATATCSSPGGRASGIELVNAGSVGLPWDGDVRAAYAPLDDDDTLALRRVAYDVEAAATRRRGLGEPWATITAQRLRTARF